MGSAAVAESKDGRRAVQQSCPVVLDGLALTAQKQKRPDVQREPFKLVGDVLLRKSPRAKHEILNVSSDEFQRCQFLQESKAPAEAQQQQANPDAPAVSGYDRCCIRRVATNTQHEKPEARHFQCKQR